MAKRGRKRKVSGSKARNPVALFLRPTSEREAHNDFQSAGAAVRVKPVIDSLLASGKLTQARYDALRYYREQAQRAEDDMAQESPISPQKVMGGVSGGSPGSKVPVSVLLATPAILATAEVERDLGSLLGIARAIAVEDMTLSQWCIEQHGGRERYDGNGKFVAIVPVSERKTMDLALMHLRMAADRIVAGS